MTYKTTTILLTPEELKKAKQEALNRGMSLSALLRALLNAMFTGMVHINVLKEGGEKI